MLGFGLCGAGSRHLAFVVLLSGPGVRGLGYIRLRIATFETVHLQVTMFVGADALTE